MLALSQCSPQCQRAMTFACRRPIQLCARVSSASSRQFALCARRIQYPDRFVQHRLSSLNQWTRKMATEASSSAQNVAAKHHQGLARRLWEKYNMWLDKQPLLTKMGTSIVLATTGDLICQLAFEDKAYSFRRSVEIMTLGAFLIGPAFHYWYTFLAQFIPGNSWASIFKRLAMDQILFGPTFIAAVFAYMATIQGKSEEAAERIQLYWPQAVVANWKLWVPAQLFNFSVVPVKYQVLYANFFSMIWNGYLSWATNRNIGDSAEELEEMIEEQEEHRHELEEERGQEEQSK